MRQTTRKKLVGGTESIVRGINKKLSEGTPLSVHELAEIGRRNEALYKTVVEEDFKGVHDCYGKRRFSRRRLSDRSTEIQCNLETMKTMDEAYQSASKRVEQKKADKDSLEGEFIARKQEYITAKLAFESAQEALENAERDLKQARESEDWYLSEYLRLMTVDEEMKKVVLVHPSASMKQLKQYQHRIIVMTDEDSEDAAIIGSVDETFEADYSLVENLPYTLIGKEWNKEEKSAIAFASMVIYYQVLSEEDFVYIYGSPLIAEILRANDIAV